MFSSVQTGIQTHSSEISWHQNTLKQARHIRPLDHPCSTIIKLRLSGVTFPRQLLSNVDRNTVHDTLGMWIGFYNQLNYLSLMILYINLRYSHRYNCIICTSELVTTLRTTDIIHRITSYGDTRLQIQSVYLINSIKYQSNNVRFIHLQKHSLFFSAWIRTQATHILWYQIALQYFKSAGPLDKQNLVFGGYMFPFLVSFYLVL